MAPPSTGTGSMKILKFRFSKSTAYNRVITNVVQMLIQVCKHCEKNIPAFALEPIWKTTEELDAIIRQSRKGLVMSQRKNLIVIHGDRIRTFGNRYMLERYPDDSSICVTVTGSARLHDFFIDVSKNGNVIMSYKGQEKKLSIENRMWWKCNFQLFHQMKSIAVTRIIALFVRLK